ncbi:winged helix-turn-helix domain-containing protein [uncultured Microbulbifer sp.]|uniref:helix-turn-helix domain-containing protein n=1 Tax=uncultured Microbulbifer sp. TaxID=348147 RepID=UPI002607FE74|nr:winged helix-turn-helix domain-containing protein [uncultured Microbulbifer sp.]
MRTLKKEDARTLSSAAKEEKRKQAIRLREEGYSYKDIADMVGVHFETVGKWYRAYSAQGLEGISAKQLGRKPGTGRLLTEEQEIQIETLIVNKTPQQMKLAYPLWTRRAVQQLIKQEFNIRIAIRTVGDLLARRECTPQKPLRQADESNQYRVENGLVEKYALIQSKAQKENAGIYWVNGVGAPSDCQTKRGLALQALKPVIRLNTKHTS